MVNKSENLESKLKSSKDCVPLHETKCSPQNVIFNLDLLSRGTKVRLAAMTTEFALFIQHCVEWLALKCPLDIIRQKVMHEALRWGCIFISSRQRWSNCKLFFCVFHTLLLHNVCISSKVHSMSVFDLYIKLHYGNKTGVDCKTTDDLVGLLVNANSFIYVKPF